MNQNIISAHDARHIVLTWWLNTFFAEIHTAIHEGWTHCHVARPWATSLRICHRSPPQFVLNNMKKLGYQTEVRDTTIHISWDND